VISGAAFCPHPPILVPEIASGAAPELDELRSTCCDAVAAVTSGGAQPVLIGAGPTSRAHSPRSRGSLAGFGVRTEIPLGDPGLGGPVDLPLSLTVGAWLVREVLGPCSGTRGFSVGADFGGSRAAAGLLALADTADVALIVMGDGSARRSTSAPGYLDGRAAAFDAAVADALGGGDAAALGSLDAALGAELLVAGVPAWRAAGTVLTGQGYDATLRFDAAPYGVGYFVAEWHARRSAW
jgi:hypothetical protein